VVIGAIIIATAEEPAISTALGTDEQHLVVKGPLGCVEIMGRSVVEHMVDNTGAASNSQAATRSWHRWWHRGRSV